MKRLLCAVLVLILLPVCACADLTAQFREMGDLCATYADIFDVSGVSVDGFSVAGKDRTFYSCALPSGLIVGFSSSDGETVSMAFVRRGSRELTYDFLALCSAVIYTLVDDSNLKSSMMSQLLLSYLISEKENDDGLDIIAGNYAGGISKEDDGYQFVLIRVNGE